MKKPKLVIIIMVLATVVLGAMISMVKVDTDPEKRVVSRDVIAPAMLIPLSRPARDRYALNG